MFLAHFGVAFAAKRAAPRTSLATLVAAAQLIDLVWPVLLLLGVEVVRIEPASSPLLRLDFVWYPWTHSLLMVAAWATAFALAYRARTGYARGAWIVGALVLSHWALDAVAHRPDLQLVPASGTRVGLGLWSSLPATIAIEGALLAAGVAVYARTTRPLRRAGSVGFWVFVAFLVVAYLSSLVSVPPNPTAVGVGSLVGWILLPWIAWFDGRRSPSLQEPGGGPAARAARPRDPGRFG